MPNSITLKVRGYHLDMYGHVNNARYLEFLEEARWSLIENHIDLAEFEKAGLAFAVVNININYRKPAFRDQILKIESGLAKIGNTSAVIHQKIFLAEYKIKIADADVTFVIINLKSQKPIRFVGEYRKMLEHLTKI